MPILQQNITGKGRAVNRAKKRSGSGESMTDGHPVFQGIMADSEDVLPSVYGVYQRFACRLRDRLTKL